MVRVSSVDGDPVYRYDIRSDHSERSRRNRWPVFGRRRARSERSYHAHNDDIYSYTTRRTATDLLYGGAGSSSRTYSYGGRGHIHTRYNPTRSWDDDILSSSQRSRHSRRSRSWRRAQPLAARTIISHLSRRRRTQGTYQDERSGNKAQYLDEGSRKSWNESGYSSYSGSTYPRFVVPGWAHIVLGIFLIVVGIVDVAWTASKYESECDFDKDNTYNPCAAENIYSYIAAPLWGGLLMVFAGALTFLMTPYRLLYSGWMVFVYMGICFFLFIAICPAIISLSILSIVENEDTYWADVPDKGLMLKDNTRFALSVVITILASLDWIVCAISIVIGLCCPPEAETDTAHEPFATRGYHNYMEPGAIIEEDRRSRSSRHNYPLDIPPLRGYGLKSTDNRSEGRVARGDVIVHEEVIRPNGARRSHSGSYGDDLITLGDSRYGDRVVHEERIRPRDGRRSHGGSYHGDDILTVSDSRYSRDDYRRGRRDHARSDRPRDILPLY